MPARAPCTHPPQEYPKGRKRPYLRGATGIPPARRRFKEPRLAARSPRVSGPFGSAATPQPPALRRRRHARAACAERRAGGCGWRLRLRLRLTATAAADGCGCGSEHKLRLGRTDDRDNDRKDAERGREDFDDQNLDEERTVLRVSERTAAAADTDAHAARKIAKAATDARPEDGIAGVGLHGREPHLVGDDFVLRALNLGLAARETEEMRWERGRGENGEERTQVARRRRRRRSGERTMRWGSR
eukprot:2861542-Prymnesium_polylepis.1